MAGAYFLADLRDYAEAGDFSPRLFRIGFKS
jgi:hypothetical protein